MPDNSEDSARRRQVVEADRRVFALAPTSLSRWAPSPPSLRAVDSCALTGPNSPRDVVHLDVTNDSLRPQNHHPALTPIDGQAPELLWSVPLTDEQGQADPVDRGRGEGDGNTTHHADQLTGPLKQLRTERTAAQPQPSGGRHVRLSTVERTGGHLVSASAGHTAARLPPLENSARGSVRPRGAPHRAGRCSVVLTCAVGLLLRRATSIEQLTWFAATVAAVAPTGRLQPVPPPPATRLPIAAQRRRYSPGQRRAPVTASGRASTRAPVDARPAVSTVQPGAALKATSHLADVAAVAKTHSLEHIHRERASVGTHTREWILANRCSSRRAYRYLIAATATIAVMDTDRTTSAATARVAVIMRLPLLLRSGLEQRAAAASAASMNSYLESLVVRDLAAPADRAFEVFAETTWNARGTRGGRPAKGPRSVILIRVDPSIRERIHQRAAALGLRVNVYLESLVSQDISAAPAREEMALDQTA